MMSEQRPLDETVKRGGKERSLLTKGWKIVEEDEEIGIYSHRQIWFKEI